MLVNEPSCESSSGIPAENSTGSTRMAAYGIPVAVAPLATTNRPIAGPSSAALGHRVAAPVPALRTHRGAFAGIPARFRQRAQIRHFKQDQECAGDARPQCPSSVATNSRRECRLRAPASERERSDKDENDAGIAEREPDAHHVDRIPLSANSFRVVLSIAAISSAVT